MNKLIAILLICLLYLPFYGSREDSIKKRDYHLRFSTSAALNNSNFNIEDLSSYSSQSSLTTYYKSASYSSGYNAKFSPGINIKADLVWAAGFKMCAGFFYNNIKITTPDIACPAYEKRDYVHGSQSNPIYDSSQVFYMGTEHFKDNITIRYWGVALGIGYSKKIRRFIFDIDGMVRASPELKTTINRTYDSQTSGYAGKTHFETTLHDPLQNKFSKPSNFEARFFYSPSFYLTVNYQLWKGIYANVGTSYIVIVSPLKNNPEDFGYPESGNIKISNFKQVSLYVGFTFAIR